MGKCSSRHLFSYGGFGKPLSYTYRSNVTVEHLAQEVELESLDLLVLRLPRLPKNVLKPTLNCVGFLDLSTEGEINMGLPSSLVLSMERAA